jgi:hypothetical protein
VLARRTSGRVRVDVGTSARQLVVMVVLERRTRINGRWYGRGTVLATGRSWLDPRSASTRRMVTVRTTRRGRGALAGASSTLRTKVIAVVIRRDHTRTTASRLVLLRR